MRLEKYNFIVIVISAVLTFYVTSSGQSDATNKPTLLEKAQALASTSAALSVGYISWRTTKTISECSGKALLNALLYDPQQLKTLDAKVIALMVAGGLATSSYITYLMGKKAWSYSQLFQPEFIKSLKNPLPFTCPRPPSLENASPVATID